MTTRRVTIATMLLTDGYRTIYGIYRAELHRADRPVSDQFVDLETAERVGTVRVARGEAFDYLEAAKQFATEEWPAIDWPKDDPLAYAPEDSIPDEIQSAHAHAEQRGN